MQLLADEAVRTLVALGWVAAGFLYELGVTLDWRGVRVLTKPSGGAATLEAQLLAQEQELQRSVVVAPGEEVQEVQDERADDVEDEEGHRQAPLAVRSVGRGQRSTSQAVFRGVKPKREFWYPTRGA